MQHKGEIVRQDVDTICDSYTVLAQRTQYNSGWDLCKRSVTKRLSANHSKALLQFFAPHLQFVGTDETKRFSILTRVILPREQHATFL